MYLFVSVAQLKQRVHGKLFFQQFEVAGLSGLKQRMLHRVLHVTSMTRSLDTYQRGDHTRDEPAVCILLEVGKVT